MDEKELQAKLFADIVPPLIVKHGMDRALKLMGALVPVIATTFDTLKITPDDLRADVLMAVVSIFSTMDAILALSPLRRRATRED